MKKYLAFLCAMCMLFSFAACGKTDSEAKAKQSGQAASDSASDEENTPEAIVKQFCSAMQKFDLTAMGDASLSEEDLQEQLDTADEMTRAMYDYFEKSAPKMTYEITDYAESGEKATVTVKFNYVDCSNLFLTTINDWAAQMLESDSSDGEEEYMAAFISLLTENTEKVETVMKDSEMTFICAKDEKGTWKIEQIPDGALDVLTCNLQEAVDQLNEMMTSADTGSN